MAEKISQELKELYNKVSELEDEMSVTTKSNIYVDDLKKSKKLLIYRYVLLLQIKDIRNERRKIETRIAKINTLQAQAARGRLLTTRESEAINNINKDIRKREDIVELYDNKKEMYSDKRLAYYGMDDKLIDIIYKYASDIEPYFVCNEKNVNELKRQLDENNNINDNMNQSEIISANEDRYGDEIVDFELGIIFDTDNKDTDELKNKIETNNEITNSNEQETNDNKIETKKFNYYNGYNLFKEDMDEIIFDSIDKEIIEDVLKQKESSNLSEDNTNKEAADRTRYTGSNIKKTIKTVKDKIDLKEKLENYINEFGNDYTREYYNNVIRNEKLDSQEDIDRIDNDLYLDIYQLGILYHLDKLIKRKKSEGSDPNEIKILINKLYQSKMQYKLFPGLCFEDTSEYEPEKIIEEIKKFDDCNTMLDSNEMFRIANLCTYSTEDIKNAYKQFYGIDNIIAIQNDMVTEEKDDTNEIEN